MGGCVAFWLLCACDKKKFVHTFGLIRRRRRRRRRRFVCRLKKKSNQKRDRSNVKCQRQKRKKGREKPIYPLELLPPQSDFQGKKIFEEKF